jgi:N-acetylmuramoyl-L-alanine amidase
MKKLPLVSVLLVSAILAVSCASVPYAVSNKLYKKQIKSFTKSLRQAPPVTAGADSLNISPIWVGTVNFGLRKPNYVIIHHTAQNSTEQTLKTFTTVSTQVSAHYVIGRDGKIYHMLNDYMRAWHAGVAKWGNETDINSSSIGIELDNNGSEQFSDAQINSLLKLLGNLKKAYNIPLANFIGHSDIAPGRKADPSAYFPWKTLAQKGFGLWYDEVLETPPATFDPAEALRIIGYDIKDLNVAISAFKLHFIQTDVTPQLTDPDKNVLYNLYKKYL